MLLKGPVRGPVASDLPDLRRYASQAPEDLSEVLSTEKGETFRAANHSLGAGQSLLSPTPAC